MMDLVLKVLIQDVEQAKNRFNNADDDYMSIATYELMAAEERLNQYIKEQKEKAPTADQAK